ncbi:MAG: response regulator [Gammaproteobacteria bacterium]|nr:response regulator [Gammaproteobacteria bacterium]
MDSNNFYAYIPFFSFLLTIVVTTYIQARTRSSRLKHAYVLFSISLTMWIFWDFVLWLRIDEGWYLTILKLQSIFWIPIGVLFLNFVYAYLDRKPDRFFYPVAILSLVLVVISLSSDLVLTGYREVYWGILHQSGILHTPITLFVVSLPMFVGLFLLIKRYRKTSQKLERTQLSFIIFGALSASIISFITTILFPDIMGRTDIFPLHDIGIAIHSIFTSIAVSRYRFLNIEVQDVAEDMFARMQDGVVILDRNGMMQHANASARDMLGLGHGVLVRKEIDGYFEAYPKLTGFSNHELMPKNASEGTYYSVSQAVAEDKAGEAGRLIIIRDITEQKKREKEIEQINQKLASARDDALEASKLKSQFLANMSHELRTPLNAVIGYSEMIEEEANDQGVDQIASDASKINRAGRHLLSLINDILDLSKIEAGRMDVYVERFDINAMLNDVITTATPLVDKNQNQLIADIQPDMGLMQSDQIKVRQILLNLISNAAKFTNEGKITIRANTGSENSRNHVKIEISDTGIGMNEQQLNSLYSAFTQADSSTTRKYGGTGLGMAISKHFIDILKGDIEVESEYGEGTSFRLYLPLEHHQPKPVSEGVLPEAIERKERRHTDAQIQEDVNVLVVDDDPATRELIVRHLTQEGLTVAEAENGKEGIRMAHRYHPEVITLDVMMPDMDGWDVLNSLKQDPELCHVPVIMVSMLDNQNLGYALGAAEYIVKPVVRHHLLEVVERSLRKNHDDFVLVVEDDEDMRKLMTTLLHEAGIKTLEAEHGKQALDILNQHNPALILLDLVMPEMDGFEFLKNLRGIGKHKNTPVVVMSAAELNSETHTQLQAAVEYVVSKHTMSPRQMAEDIKSLVG